MAQMAAEELWTIQRVLRWTQGRFAERGLATARLDAELLLAEVLKVDRVRLYTHFDQPLSADELAAYKALIKRRLAGEPVAYLLGRREFRSLSLVVDPRVLVPRPDTETAVDEALARLGARAAPIIVDIGTGSGAIALALKSARPEAKVIAVDISPDAVAVARDNAARLALDIDVRQGDLLEPVAETGLDLVISNPPYIPSGEIAALPAEVQKEPRLALDGGADGLDVLRRLIAATRARLSPGGSLVVELGAGQADAVAALFAEAGFQDIRRARDLGGIERVVSGAVP
jgi:release factor glutamine methyltransferase